METFNDMLVYVDNQADLFGMGDAWGFSPYAGLLHELTYRVRQKRGLGDGFYAQPVTFAEHLTPIEFDNKLREMNKLYEENHSKTATIVYMLLDFLKNT